MDRQWAGFLISSAAWQGIPHSEAIESVRATGFGGVEILCKPGHFECGNSEHVEEVQSALDDWPEAVVTFHAPFHDLDLAGSEAHEYALRAAGVAFHLRAETMTVHARGLNGPRDWDEGAFHMFRENLSALSDCGVSITVENQLPPRFTSHEDDLLRLVDGFPNVGFCIDTGHAHIAGRVVELTRALADRALITHLHDNSGDGDKHLLPGEGTIPWPAVLKALRDFHGRPVIESVKIESLDALKTALNDTGLADWMRTYQSSRLR